MFFPSNQPQFINAFIEAPIGTDILKTDSITRVVEAQVMKVVNDPQYSEVRELKDEDGNVIGKDTVNFLVKFRDRASGPGHQRSWYRAGGIGSYAEQRACADQLREIRRP
ncbi:MAG: hypothetical protein IPI91_16530 [Flavobacteriales bacterium]|nr:hypothetical protein [Flavobacteriales bacterium]